MPIKETVGREFPSSGEPWACVLNDSTLDCLLYGGAGPGWRIETEGEHVLLAPCQGGE